MKIKELEQLLANKEIKPTAMRLLVLEYLLGQETAISLKEVEEAFEKADRITLYRTLKTFEEKGMIHQIEDGSGAAKWALCDDSCTATQHQDTHAHFYCTSCQKTSCLPGSVQPKLQLPEKFSLQEIAITARGVCADCR